MVIVISSIVNFLIVLFILWWFGRKPVADFFSHRRQAIQNAISEAETQYQQAEKELRTWQTKVEQSATEAKGMLDDAQKTLERFRERTLSAARAEAERIERESDLLSKGEILRARQTLRQEVAEKSIALAQRYLTKQLDERDKHQLVSEYVEIVGNGKV